MCSRREFLDLLEDDRDRPHQKRRVELNSFLYSRGAYLIKARGVIPMTSRGRILRIRYDNEFVPQPSW